MPVQKPFLRKLRKNAEFKACARVLKNLGIGDEYRGKHKVYVGFFRLLRESQDFIALNPHSAFLARLWRCCKHYGCNGILLYVVAPKLVYVYLAEYNVAVNHKKVRAYLSFQEPQGVCCAA